MELETVVLISIGMMGTVGLFILQGIRSDIRDLWKEVGEHLRDRDLHTHCGKGHE